MVFSKVVDMIMTKEIRRKEEGPSASASALNVESGDKNRYRGNQRGKSKSGNGRSKSRNHQYNKGKNINVECWNCGKMGHFKSECRGSKKESNKQANANVVSNDSDDALICSMESETKSWVLDLRLHSMLPQTSKCLRTMPQEIWERCISAMIRCATSLVKEQYKSN